MIENEEKRTTYKYSLLEVEHKVVNIPAKEFESVITLPSSDFQKICRDMSNMGAEKMDIKTMDNQLILNCSGLNNDVEVEVVIRQKDSDDLKETSLTQGVFPLKYLLMFTKATNLSGTMNIYLANDCPIILEYGVSTLGKVKFILNPLY